MSEDEREIQPSDSPESKRPPLHYDSPFRPAAARSETAGGPVAPATAPRSARWLLLPAAIVALTLVASAGGAVLAHEFWTTSTPATSPLAAAGSSTGASPGSLGGESAGLGGSASSLPSSGSSGVSSGGSGVSLGPNGISVTFPNSGSSASSTGGPSDADSVAAKVDPGLVDIDTSYSYQGAEGAGTGIVLTSNGEVVTNNHVIDGATRITATDIGNGKTYTATVVGYSPTRDIAVIQLQGASGLTTEKLANSSKVALGTEVLGIGNAGGVGGTPSVAGGTVTALNQSITASDENGDNPEPLSGLIETNAGIQPGDSGGPLVDSKGQVLGMDTAGSGQRGGGFGFQQVAGQAYSIPSDEVASTALQIVSGHASSTVHVGASAFLGVQVSPPPAAGSGFGASSSGSGVAIAAVVSGEPAQRAGLAAGDVITSLNGQAVSTTSQLGSLLLVHHPGDTVKVAWTTGSGLSKSASITLASGPPS
jgi:S1-C subfamily serine protease